MNKESKLSNEVNNVIALVDNSSTSNVDEILKPFKEFKTTELRYANRRVAGELQKRASAHQPETEHLLALSQRLLHLTLTSVGNSSNAASSNATS